MLRFLFAQGFTPPNTAIRSKKFAAYESILYHNHNKAATHFSSRSSSLSSNSTPLLEQPTKFHIEQYNKKHIVAKTNNNQILCRLGASCRFKRENKCRYYHPLNLTIRNSNFSNYPSSNKYKNEPSIEISDYTIENINNEDFNDKLEFVTKKDFKFNEDSQSSTDGEKHSNAETYSSSSSMAGDLEAFKIDIDSALGLNVEKQSRKQLGTKT